MSSPKLLSIIILSCNRFDLLKTTITSLIDSITYPLWEMIIYNHQKGQAEGWLKLLDSVKGEYILNCEDDWIFSERGNWIQDAIEILEKNPKVGIVRLRKEKNGQGKERIIKKIDKGILIHCPKSCFTLNPSIAKTETIQKLKTKIQLGKDCEKTLRYYYAIEFGYQTAKLNYPLTGVCRHTGKGGRSLLKHKY